MNPLETYLKDIRDIHSTGAAVKELSFYPPLSNLLNEIGKSLKPKVRCVINIANRGAGLPDGGLFTTDQFQKATDAKPKEGQRPARGVLEIKGFADDVSTIAHSEQVKGYSKEYGLVLVTNYRDFLLLGRDEHDNPLPMETYTLADTEAAFRQATAHPQKTAQEHGERFVEYLKRVMLSVAPLSTPQDVAWFLASYARDAKARVENHKDLSALSAVREALQEALGMTFAGEKGEHFFRSTLVQTLFYGVFSAWVRWHKDNLPGTNPKAKFDWRTAEWSLHVPFIRTLYRQVAEPNQLGQLRLVEVLDWTASVLNRVNRAIFFKNFEDEYAVQYFYEPFLEAYDPELRKALGVWYTPPEIVKYQVARVDRVLREELDLADGLADPNVIVLDPCCGTGAYLVEVLRSIETTLRNKHDDALIGYDVKTAAMTRIFGFEIMPAPFVVAHLQIGLLLQEIGLPFSQNRGERAAVYLTNALTGWEPPKGPKQQIMQWAELQQERDAAEHVKRYKKILVVLGNPPYNAFAGVSPEEEQGLVEPYKVGLNKPVAEGGWGIKKFNLDDLYIRFFRLAERRITEMSGMGVVSFISNFSYLSDPSFVVMRQRFLAEFDKLWFDCMNGDSRETGKLTPDGKPDPSVFSTEYNREGIRVGTAICVMVRKQKRNFKPTVLFRQFWGTTKRQDLLASLKQKRNVMVKAAPARQNRSSFRPEDVSAHYTDWPKFTDLCAVSPFNGPVERRGNSLIRISADVHEFECLKTYLNPEIEDSDIQHIEPRFMESSGEFHAKESRAALMGKVTFQPQNLVRYPFKPFDVRLAYLDADIQPLFSRPSPYLLKQRFLDNSFFITRDTADKSPEGPPFFFSRLVCDYDTISGHARHFPIRLKNGSRLEKEAEATLFAVLGEKPETDEPVANLSAQAREYLQALKLKNADADTRTARLLWMHALAIGYSPAYLTENADGIRRDWPRIPLPGKRKSLESSAELGEQIAALLDTEAEVRAVTTGPLEPIFRTIAVLSKVGGGKANVDAGDLAVTAGWGHKGKDGVVMPAKGRIVERPFDKAELDAISDTAKARGLSTKQALALLGENTRDVYLNDKAYWRNVPGAVWEYFIGGYQVIKKWLSYREQKLLGRALTADEAREVIGTTRRLTALVLLQPALDENYRRAAANAYPWRTADWQEADAASGPQRRE